MHSFSQAQHHHRHHSELRGRQRHLQALLGWRARPLAREGAGAAERQLRRASRPTSRLPFPASLSGGGVPTTSPPIVPHRFHCARGRLLGEHGPVQWQLQPLRRRPGKWDVCAVREEVRRRGGLRGVQHIPRGASSVLYLPQGDEVTLFCVGGLLHLCAGCRRRGYVGRRSRRTCLVSMLKN